LCLALAVPIATAGADPWKDESGHGRDRGYSRHYDRDDDDRGRGRRGGERKVEYDDGRCKVERKWGRGGEYKEERKCRGGPSRDERYGRRDYRDGQAYGSSVLAET
jgi:hypothetical protein